MVSLSLFFLEHTKLTDMHLSSGIHLRMIFTTIPPNPNNKEINQPIIPSPYNIITMPKEKAYPRCRSKGNVSNGKYHDLKDKDSNDYRCKIT